MDTTYDYRPGEVVLYRKVGAAQEPCSHGCTHRVALYEVRPVSGGADAVVAAQAEGWSLVRPRPDTLARSTEGDPLTPATPIRDAPRIQVARQVIEHAVREGDEYVSVVNAVSLGLTLEDFTEAEQENALLMGFSFTGRLPGDAALLELLLESLDEDPLGAAARALARAEREGIEVFERTVTSYAHVPATYSPWRTRPQREGSAA